MYIKKSELKKATLECFDDDFTKQGFKLIKSKGRFIKQLEGVNVMIDCRILDSYNFKKDNVAWEIEIVFFLGYEVVHNWFEQFEHRQKKDYKFYWTVGSTLSDRLNKKFDIDVDENNLDYKLFELKSVVLRELNHFLSDNSSLKKIADNRIPYPLDSLDKIDNLKNFNVRTAIEFLSIAWILKRDDFNHILEVSIKKIQQLYDIGDPMAKIYFPIFDKIVESLKSSDFSGFKTTMENG